MSTVKDEAYVVSIEQLNDMKHAIGFRLDRCKKKKGRLIYVAYRNYYDAGKIERSDLDSLVEQGFMTKREVSEMWGGGTWYYVTPKGFEYIESVTGITIEKQE